MAEHLLADPVNLHPRRSAAKVGRHRLCNLHRSPLVVLGRGGPQWVGRMIRIGMASTVIDTVAEEVAMMVRRAFTVR